MPVPLTPPPTTSRSQLAGVAPLIRRSGRDLPVRCSRRALARRLPPVIVRVVGGESLEAAMNPKVLLGSEAHLCLDHAVEARGVGRGTVSREVVDRRVDHPEIA